MLGVDQVIAAESLDGASRQSAVAAMSGTVGDTSAEAGRFRVVHTSGEKVVATMAEARALLSRLPGARVFCAGVLRH